jgi:hypothetical protein
MRRSIETRPNRWDLLVALVVAALAAACAAGLWFYGGSGSSGALTAVVSAGGTEVDRVVLSSLSGEESRSYSNNGYTLTAVFTSGGVRVSASDCPNQDCVKTGTISAAGQSIVCLPARITIQLTGSDSGGADVVIG